MDAFIGLGSNLGDPVSELQEAVHALDGAGCEVVRHSSLYRTEPVEADPSRWFVNSAAQVLFDGTPDELLALCLGIEAARGRRRTTKHAARTPHPTKHAARTLDLDLLMAGNAVVRTEELTLPHPRFHLRRFVLVPLAEIAPEALHPVLGRTVRALLAECSDPSRVDRLSSTLAP